MTEEDESPGSRNSPVESFYFLHHLLYLHNRPMLTVMKVCKSWDSKKCSVVEEAITQRLRTFPCFSISSNMRWRQYFDSFFSTSAFLFSSWVTRAHASALNIAYDNSTTCSISLPIMNTIFWGNYTAISVTSWNIIEENLHVATAAASVSAPWLRAHDNRYYDRC